MNKSALANSSGRSAIQRDTSFGENQSPSKRGRPLGRVVNKQNVAVPDFSFSGFVGMEQPL
jgi:hypothetical protein